MSDKIKSLEVGQIIEAAVIAVSDASRVVVSIDGNFLQIENQSAMKMSVGQTVRLVVDSVLPLRLKLQKLSQVGRTDYNV